MYDILLVDEHGPFGLTLRIDFGLSLGLVSCVVTDHLGIPLFLILAGSQ